MAINYLALFTSKKLLGKASKNLENYIRKKRVVHNAGTAGDRA
jgi:hypothetical protein